jgi:hypothetical protein
MKQTTEFEDGYEDVDGVPVSAVLSVQRANRYGSVQGLDDEELADPDELERQAMAEEWAPILALPVKTRRGWVQPNIDESGHVDWGAFGTVDFDRIGADFDKAKYKADKLREQLGDVLIMLSIVSGRVSGKAKYRVMKHLKTGVIDLDHILDEEIRAMGRLYLRARRIQQEIAEVWEARAKAREAKARAFWGD